MTVSLGVDIGFSSEVASTGICVISPTHIEPVRVMHVTTKQTLQAIRNILRGECPTSISIDGPLVPSANGYLQGFRLVNQYRGCEKKLSGGIFQKRCKPGSTNTPRGQALHRQATYVANSLLMDHPESRIVEAFPNAFLGVMMPSTIFKQPIRRGIKSDVFWQVGIRRKILDRLISSLYGAYSTRLSYHWRGIKNHDERAAFICALSARTSEVGNGVTVWGGDDGEFILPPAAFFQSWAINELDKRLALAPKGSNWGR